MNCKRKIFMIFILFCLIFTNFNFASEPTIASTAVILMEPTTGKILYEKNAYDKMYPASTTKILTAILVLENCDLKEKAVVSKNAIFSIPNGYVNCNLHEGEELSVNDLMYALMVKSANDAAVVLAEHIGGSVENFADMMNKKAKEMGCKNTHFVNPNGIHHEDHYSTAYDLAIMAMYGMQNETFRNYVSTKSYTLPATNKHPTADRICLTTNDMLRPNSRYYDENVIGIKTGYTTEARNCLIAGARKNDVELISVTLHAGTNAEGLSERYLDTKALFDYGFDNFQFSDIVQEKDIVQTIEIKNGTKDTKNLDLITKDTLSAYLKKELDLDGLAPSITLHENLEAPIQTGDSLGSLTYTIDGIEYSTELLAKSNVEKKLNIEIVVLIGGILLLMFGIMILKISTKKKVKKKKFRK